MAPGQRPQPRHQPAIAVSRFPLLALGMACMVAGIWGGLARIGWTLPGAAPADLARLHGPLMVLGFLGTVISMERAVALKRGWGYAAPAGLLIGTVLIYAGGPLIIGQLLQLAGAILLTALLALVVRIQPNAANVALVAAALLVVASIVLWIDGLAIPRLVPWWAGFLMLTILGERLELAAMGRLDARGRLLFGLLSLGLVGSLITIAAGGEQTGVRTLGTVALGYALWLAWYDIARHTIKRRGLARFVAAALLPGYVWLGFGGLLWLVHGFTAGGPIYDAQLHAVLLGFVFSMIFGHAPVIFPGVLGVPIPYRTSFYVHLVLLHVGLALRVTGDLAGWAGVARAGAMVSGLAIALFLVMTVGSGVRAAIARRRRIL